MEIVDVVGDSDSVDVVVVAAVVVGSMDVVVVFTDAFGVDVIIPVVVKSSFVVVRTAVVVVDSTVEACSSESGCVE